MHRTCLILVLGFLLIVPFCLDTEAYGQETSQTRDQARIPIGILKDYR